MKIETKYFDDLQATLIRISNHKIEYAQLIEDSLDPNDFFIKLKELIASAEKELIQIK